MVTIYKITSPTGRIYIGQSRNYKVRLQEYKRMKCQAQTRLYASFKKYGIDNHIFEVIEKCDLSISDIREIHYISYYNSFKGRKGLNSTEGGHKPQIKKGKNHYKAKVVYQWDFNGNLIKKWDCIKDVQIQFGYSSTTIGMSIKANVSCYGYRWTFDNTSPGKYISQRINNPKSSAHKLI